MNAYLARAGVASRRGADALIKSGRVTVDGRPGELNTFVERSTVVLVDGREVGKQALRHVLLNKPRGTIATARDPKGRPTVVDLVGGDTRVVPVGRLDRDTTGVLLLTNDGPLVREFEGRVRELCEVYPSTSSSASRRQRGCTATRSRPCSSRRTFSRVATSARAAIGWRRTSSDRTSCGSLS